MNGGQQGSRFYLERDRREKRTYALRGEGPPVGWLQLSGGFGRAATVTVDGDSWQLTQRGMFRRKIYVQSQTTRQLLAQMTGNDLAVSGGPNLRWERPTFFNWGGSHSFVRSDRVAVAQFSRLKGVLNHSLEIDLMSGDQHVDLICAFVGSWMMFLQAQANGSSAVIASQ